MTAAAPPPVEVIRGEGPVILGQPHAGTFVPDDILRRLNAAGRALTDTDWHIGTLYDGLLPGATVVRATFHRYVIDANRPPGGESLYPGRNTTGLCPVTDFDGREIYHMGEAPEADEVAERLARFHAPYHAALAAEVARVRARHGFAILYDCHSIRSEIPFLFEGTLPVLNIGTDGGRTCDGTIEALVAARCGLGRAPREGGGRSGGAAPAPPGYFGKEEAGAESPGDAGATADGAESAGTASPDAIPFPAVLNGRFRGGWTTRHYGRPAEGIHAIQMEIAQRAYLAAEAPPWAFDAARAARLRALLARILADLADWRPR
jgi:formiminoglutamase